VDLGLMERLVQSQMVVNGVADTYLIDEVGIVARGLKTSQQRWINCSSLKFR